MPFADSWKWLFPREGMKVVSWEHENPEETETMRGP